MRHFVFSIARHLGGEGVSIDGEHVPPDTALILFVFGLHRNPAVWDDPDEFRPERFLHRKVKNMVTIIIR